MMPSSSTLPGCKSDPKATPLSRVAPCAAASSVSSRPSATTPSAPRFLPTAETAHRLATHSARAARAASVTNEPTKPGPWTRHCPQAPRRWKRVRGRRIALQARSRCLASTCRADRSPPPSRRPAAQPSLAPPLPWCAQPLQAAKRNLAAQKHPRTWRSWTTARHSCNCTPARLSTGRGNR
eukprot:scaffold21571_cov120-Isochrysis_galbana.AAC.2